MGEKWTEYRLKELGKIISGDTPNTKKKEYFGGSIPWITPKDLSDHKERYVQYGERMITEKGFASCATHKIPPLSILFSSRAPIGRMAITKGEVCTSQGFKAIVPNETVDYLFLYYLLKYYRDKIITMGSGSTFREITTDVLSNISVRIPKKREEQERIGRILDSLDSKIELDYRINDNFYFRLDCFDIEIPTIEAEKSIILSYKLLFTKRNSRMNAVIL